MRGRQPATRQAPVRNQTCRYGGGARLQRMCSEDALRPAEEPENLCSAERDKLAEVQANNRPLYRAYLPKHACLDPGSSSVLRRSCRTPWMARMGLTLQACTFRQGGAHHPQASGWHPCLSQHSAVKGRSEGLNGKVRVITRRSYTLQSAKRPNRIHTTCVLGEPCFVASHRCSGRVRITERL
jgi:hypothetical protein